MLTRGMELHFRPAFLSQAQVHTGIGEVMVRPIGPGDADMAQGFVGSLSATSRYFRFFQALKGLSPGMLERFTRIDHPTHLALVGIARVRGQQIFHGALRGERRGR